MQQGVIGRYQIRLVIDHRLRLVTPFPSRFASLVLGQARRQLRVIPECIYIILPPSLVGSAVSSTRSMLGSHWWKHLLDVWSIRLVLGGVTIWCPYGCRRSMLALNTQYSSPFCGVCRKATGIESWWVAASSEAPTSVLTISGRYFIGWHLVCPEGGCGCRFRQDHGYQTENEKGTRSRSLSEVCDYDLRVSTPREIVCLVAKCISSSLPRFSL